jgi:hypothetical protein
MRGRRLTSCGLVIGGLLLIAAPASAQRPTCADLGTNPAYGLFGNPTVSQVSPTTPLTTFVTTGVPGVIVPYCRVDFVVSERGGPEFGYAVGENQRVVLRVGLPANSANGGTGGTAQGEGAWNGRVQNLGGGGLVGNAPGVTGATNGRYVGSSTDSGHPTSENPGFGVIQATNELNLGKIEDFFSESLRLQYQWALRLAEAYYGQPAYRNYWSGCSTGGRQGLVLASKYGNDFDGFLIGAPHTNHTRTSTSGAYRQWANKDIAGGTVTDEKLEATIERLIGACDGDDDVLDGILNEPRTCKASARLNLCGAPGAAAAPNCLNNAEAEAIDVAMDGARNDHGLRVWFSQGPAALGSMEIPSTGTAGNGVYGWANKDMTFDWRTLPSSEWDDLQELSTRTLSDLVDMGTPNLDLARLNGAKILMWHGGADGSIPWEQNVYYYNRVTDHYGGLGNVTPWFRFFMAPGVGHCSGGVGPQPQNLFGVMVNWAENGVAPDSILSANTSMGTVVRTRPLCRFPQTAIYDGTGDPNLASSFTCGGNIETFEARCDGLVVRHKHETHKVMEPLAGVNAVSCGFVPKPEWAPGPPVGRGGPPR